MYSSLILTLCSSCTKNSSCSYTVDYTHATHFISVYPIFLWLEPCSKFNVLLLHILKTC